MKIRQTVEWLTLDYRQTDRQTYVRGNHIPHKAFFMKEQKKKPTVEANESKFSVMLCSWHSCDVNVPYAQCYHQTPV
jgi:hypothetical protein